MRNYNLPSQLLFDIFSRQRYNNCIVSDLGRTGKDSILQRLQNAVSTEGGRIAVVKRKEIPLSAPRAT